MSAQDRFNYYIAQVDKELSKYPALTNFERKTSVPKSYAVLGALGVFGIFVFFNIAAGFLTNVVGVAIPAYFSLRALETPAASDDVQWLTYWTVYGVLTLVESFSSVVLYWFPFYYSAKIVFLLWLMLPQTRGAVLVYQKALRPLVAQHVSPVAPAATTAPIPTQ